MASGEWLRGICECVESDVGESLVARSESLAGFRELGPSDFVHVIKTHVGVNTNHNINSSSSSITATTTSMIAVAGGEGVPQETVVAPGDVGYYHCIDGVDVSSAASLAAYLTTLQNLIDGGGSRRMRIRQGTFACFNAFARVDVRVEIRVPGGVECFTVDLAGNRRLLPADSDAMWDECFVSGVLRSLAASSMDASLDALVNPKPRSVDPLPTPAVERRFLAACRSLWPRAWLLGTAPHIQAATPYANHMTSLLADYFAQSARPSEGAAFFASLPHAAPSTAALLLASNQEVAAVTLLHSDISSSPSWGALLAQANFLRSKKRHDLAVRVAHEAVRIAPGEFVTWECLTICLIDQADYESALITLNSCPMFTYTDHDTHHMPPPLRTHIPLKPDATSPLPIHKSAIANNHDLDGSVLDDSDPSQAQVHPELLNLPATALRGTFLKAFDLLVRVVDALGWDGCLKVRSRVFVMEEEWRVARAVVSVRETETAPFGIRSDNNNGTASGSLEQRKKTSGSQSSVESTGESIEDTVNGISKDVVEAVPTEDVSESNKENTHETADGTTEGKSDEENTQNGKLDDINLDSKSETSEKFDEEQKAASPLTSPLPEMATAPATKTEVKAKLKLENQAEAKVELKTKSQVEVDAIDQETTEEEVPAPIPIKSKRLCERWLDNLFMVLYNDLRIYTAIRAEINHYKSTSTSTKPVSTSQILLYRKTGSEWELYGDLCLRLRKPDEAMDAFKLCLSQKQSLKSYVRLLDWCSKNGDIKESFGLASRICELNDRNYVENIVPTPISSAISSLIAQHGLSKCQNVMIGMNLDLRVRKLVTRYLDWCEMFRIDGVKF